MILKLVISLIFAGAALQKFTGKVAPDWDRWGDSARRGDDRCTGHSDPVPRRTVARRHERGHAAPADGAVLPDDGCVT